MMWGYGSGWQGMRLVGAGRMVLAAVARAGDLAAGALAHSECESLDVASSYRSPES